MTLLRGALCTTAASLGVLLQTVNLQANPVSLPYQNDFNGTDASDFFCPTGNGYNWGYDWRAQNFQSWVTASRTVTATMEARSLGGPASAAADFLITVTVDPVELMGADVSVGFAACGSHRELTGSYYLADVKPAANRIRVLRLAGSTTSLVAERPVQNVNLTDLTPFHLELKGTYTGQALLLEFTVSRDNQSDTASGTDNVVLTGSHFGLRNRNPGGGSRFEFHFDDFELRPVHRVSISSEHPLFAPVGELHSYGPRVEADPVDPTQLEGLLVPAWATISNGVLSGIPEVDDVGQHEVLLQASSPHTSNQVAFRITVPAPTSVIISEFMADNDDTLQDQEGDSSDWLELFNPTSSAIDLSGWFLTDDPSLLTKWAIPIGTILPGLAFNVFFASGKVHLGHANFSINNNAGGYLALVRPDGTVQDAVVDYPRQQEDISYGVHGDYATRGYLLTPTPAQANAGTGYIGFVEAPTFSVQRGFFEGPFTADIRCGTSGAALVYTLDGSTPSLTNGTVVASGDETPPRAATVAIGSTTVLRAKAFKSGLAPSQTQSQTYLFLSDIRMQTTAPPPGWPASSVNGQVFNYGMDPDVLGALPTATFEEAMTDIGTLSLSTDLVNLTDPETGIWVNAENRGPDWERPVSLELINGNGSPGFQIDAGVRIRGGWSRQGGNPKHAFHLYFKEQYGSGKLRYPLFGPEGVDQFDRIDLRCAQGGGGCWHFGHSANATFNRDLFARHLQRDMGQPYARSRYYHVYLNGIYFGIFQTQERTDKFYAASYFGGSEADYDVMKTRTRPHRVEALDGDPTAWSRLYDAARAGFAADAAYYAVQGLDPQGHPDPTRENLLDLDNLIDYMLAIFYTGQGDGPVNLGANVPKNFFAIRPRNGRFGFRFFVHDNEDAMGSVSVNNTVDNNTGERLTHFNPKWLHQQLSVNSRYRLRFADRAQRHLFNAGALTPAAAAANFLSSASDLEKAILGESARWGDSQRSAPYLQSEWRSAVNAIVTGFVPARTPILVEQLRNRGLFPNLAAPLFNPHGGQVLPGSRLDITSSADVYFTLNGADPMDAGASLLGTAGSITLNGSATVKARSFTAGEWSALTEATFFITQPASASNFRITEIHYNPPGTSEALEFLEFQNISTQSIHLDNVRVTTAINYEFPSGTVLAAGDYLVIVNDLAAFAAVHGTNLPVAGQYAGKLSNEGEWILVLDADGQLIQQLEYGTAFPWPELPHGQGPSLVYVAGDPGAGASWRPSVGANGNPGTTDATVFSGDPAGDDDGNGVSNMMQYALGGPALPRFSFIHRGNDRYVVFSHTRNLSADALVLNLELSSDLELWTELDDHSFVLLSEAMVAPGVLERHYQSVLPGLAPFAFLRLRVEVR